MGAPSSGNGPGYGRDQEGEGFSWVPHPRELRYEGNSVTPTSPRALVTEQGNQVSNPAPYPWRAAPLQPQPQTLSEAVNTQHLVPEARPLFTVLSSSWLQTAWWEGDKPLP